MRAKYANTKFVKWILEQRGTLLWRSLLTADAWSFWKIANLWQPIKYLQRNFTVKQTIWELNTSYQLNQSTCYFWENILEISRGLAKT